MLWEAAAAAAVGLFVLWIVIAPLTQPAPDPEPELLEPEEPEETPRGAALAALKEIEFDRATEKLAEHDYAELKARYTAEAVAAMRTEDQTRRMDDVESMIAARTAALRNATPPVCSECGLRPEADAVFCSRCGRALNR
jgi:predicted Zn-ribbon and HTH transcriptional regulator